MKKFYIPEAKNIFFKLLSKSVYKAVLYSDKALKAGKCQQKLHVATDQQHQNNSHLKTLSRGKGKKR